MMGSRVIVRGWIVVGIGRWKAGFLGERISSGLGVGSLKNASLADYFQ